MTRRKTIKTRKTKRIRKKAFYGGETIQELRSENTELRTEVVHLRTENATLKETVADLIQQVNSLLQTVKDSEERIRNLEERNRALEELNAELRKENAELKQRVDVLEKRVVVLEQENTELKQSNSMLIKDIIRVKRIYHEERVITALSDVLSHEKHNTKNPLFQDFPLKRLKENRHRINHYFLEFEKTQPDIVLMREKYLYERLQEMIENKTPFIDQIDTYMQDISGNTIYQLMAILKRHIDASNIVISESERAFLDRWWRAEFEV